MKREAKAGRRGIKDVKREAKAGRRKARSVRQKAKGSEELIADGFRAVRG